METRKTNKADIEKYRPLGFLLGVLVAVSVLLAALEYTTQGKVDDSLADIMDEMVQELEMAPAVNMPDMITPTGQTAKAEAGAIKAVEQTSDDAATQDATHVDIPDVESLPNNSEADKAIPQTPSVAADSVVLTTVEKLPEFPGGIVEFMKWLTANLRYPEYARKNKIEGKVVVSFIVNKDGTIASPRIQQSADPLLDKEALRVIRLMPKWKPGTMDAKPCRTMFAIPVIFKI